MIDSYLIHLLIIIGIYLILAISLQLSLGYTGLLNLGHIAFYGIGAYVFAILSLNGVPFLINVAAAGMLSSFFGWLLSLPTKKLKGDYLALTSLGFSFVVYAVFLNWTEMTKGPFGLTGISRPRMLGVDFSDNSHFLAIVILFVFISFYVVHRICGSPFGKALEAVRDDELAARSLGKNTRRLKTLSLEVSAFFAGIAGSLFASYVTCIDPSSFSFVNLLPVLLIVMTGGLASLPGTCLAAVIITLLPEPLRFVGLPSSVLGPIRQILFACLLISILHFKPRGFFGRVDLE